MTTNEIPSNMTNIAESELQLRKEPLLGPAKQNTATSNSSSLASEIQPFSSQKPANSQIDEVMEVDNEINADADADADGLTAENSSDCYTWKPALTFPVEIAKKSSNFPTPLAQKPDGDRSKDLTLAMKEQERMALCHLLLAKMHKWTKFVHMASLERELLWLNELSDYFRGSKSKFEFIESHASHDLSDFAMRENVKNSSQLIRQFFLSIKPSIKVEFIAKRKRAKRAIEKEILRLRAVSDPREYKRQIFSHASSKWMRFHELNHNVLERGAVVYILKFCICSEGGSNIECYRGKVLGHKKVDGRIAYYCVFLDNSVVQRVFENSVLTQSEMQKISSDVEGLQTQVETKSKDANQDQTQLHVSMNSMDTKTVESHAESSPKVTVQATADERTNTITKPTIPDHPIQSVITDTVGEKLGDPSMAQTLSQSAESTGGKQV